MLTAQVGFVKGRHDVRFGSQADICSAKTHARFTPNNDRESGHAQTVMSALPPIADICSANLNVRFGPKADSCSAAKGFYSIASSAGVGPPSKQCSYRPAVPRLCPPAPTA